MCVLLSSGLSGAGCAVNVDEQTGAERELNADAAGVGRAMRGAFDEGVILALGAQIEARLSVADTRSSQFG